MHVLYHTNQKKEVCSLTEKTPGLLMGIQLRLTYINRKILCMPYHVYHTEGVIIVLIVIRIRWLTGILIDIYSHACYVHQWFTIIVY